MGMDSIKTILESQGLNNSAPVSGAVYEYKCSICNDAGFIHPRFPDGKVDWSNTTPCTCRKSTLEKERQERFLRYCKLPEKVKDWTFKNFNTYKEPVLIKALDVCQKLANGEKDVLWLTLIGESDRGKTHLAVAICKAWMDRGKVARFAVVPEMLDELQESLDMEGEESFRVKINLFYNVSLLVLDDLGTGKYSDWRREQLFKIINHRANACLPLVVTCRNEIDKIFCNDPFDLDNKNISSRLQREKYCHVVLIDGMEHRCR